VHRRADYLPPDLQKLPLSTEETCSSRARPQSVSRQLGRDLLTIVDEEARYFIPQIETKIMNEGWASWSTGDPERHRSATGNPPRVPGAPQPGGRPRRELESRTTSGEGLDRSEAPRSTSRPPPSFRRTRADPTASRAPGGARNPIATCRSCVLPHRRSHARAHLFEYEPKGDDLVISRVADKEGWREVKEQLPAASAWRACP